MAENTVQRKSFKNRNIFDYLGNILVGKSRDAYERHVSEPGFDVDFKKVVVLRYLSMSTDERVRNLVIGNQLSLERMEPKMLYRYLISKVPRQRSTFIRYLKKND